MLPAAPLLAGPRPLPPPPAPGINQQSMLLWAALRGPGLPGAPRGPGRPPSAATPSQPVGGAQPRGAASKAFGYATGSASGPGPSMPGIPAFALATAYARPGLSSPPAPTSRVPALVPRGPPAAGSSAMDAANAHNLTGSRRQVLRKHAWEIFSFFPPVPTAPATCWCPPGPLSGTQAMHTPSLPPPPPPSRFLHSRRPAVVPFFRRRHRFSG
jgi:hypothetical protein